MEGLLKNMQLTDKEKGGLKVGKIKAGKSLTTEPQAVGKIFSEKPVRADALENALGRVWCPIRGTGCKDLGENHFLFTFFQASGKRRALEDGPWNFGKDLVVVADFDGSKRVEEMDFTTIPTWVRVMKLPLGLMTKEYGEEIGKLIGEFMEMDAEDGGLAVGQCLRIKVRMDITKPLMCGITVGVEVKEEEKEIWCPFAYEFLPDFCYNCGIIGHVDRSCTQPMVKGGIKPYSSKLRVVPEKKKFSDDSYDRANQGRSMLPWRSGGSGSKNWSGSGRSGSDGPNWRKNDQRKGGKEDEQEVTSPLKQAKQDSHPSLVGPADSTKKQLRFVTKVTEEKKGVDGGQGEADRSSRMRVRRMKVIR